MVYRSNNTIDHCNYQWYLYRDRIERHLCLNQHTNHRNGECPARCDDHSRRTYHLLCRRISRSDSICRNKLPVVNFSHNTIHYSVNGW